MYRVTATILISALGLTSVSHAGSPPEVRQVVVHFADLDLTKAEGAATIYRRLQDAAEVVCGRREYRNFARTAAVEKCRQSAVAKAVVSVDRPALTEYYRARTAARNVPVLTARK